MRTTVSRILGVILGVLVAGALLGAASGITTRQARTAPPSTQTLSSSANSEGSSLSFARADHLHAFAGDKYHPFTAGTYYYDDYRQTRYFRLWEVAAFSDITRFGAVANVEYWDGAAWVAWTDGATTISPLLSGREETTVSIDHAHRSFRFEVTKSTGWPTSTITVLQTTWTGFGYPGVTVTLENKVGGTWTIRDTCVFTGANTGGDWGWHAKANTTNALHDGLNPTRVTIDIADWTDSGSYTTVPLRRFMILSNYSGLGLQPWTWNYSKVVNFAATPSAAGSTMWHAGNDGAGSGLDADLLDGMSSASFSGTGACGASTWVSALNGATAPTCTQPGFSSLSGVAALSQLTDDDASGAGTTCLKNGGAAGSPAWGTCGAGYTTIQDELTFLAQRQYLNFTGSGVTCVDNPGGFRTDCTIISAGSPPWHGKIAHAHNDGDPGAALRQMQLGGNTAPTPSELTTSVARIAFFRLASNLTVNKIRFYGIGATTNLYQVALYSYNPGGTGTRLHNQLSLTTAANTWGSATVSPAVNLTAGTLYFIAVSAAGTGVTAGIASIGTSTTSTTGQINAQPQNLPGNLDMDLGYLSGFQAQFNVTGGALPATTPALSGNAAWTGGFPALFLDESTL